MKHPALEHNDIVKEKMLIGSRHLFTYWWKDSEIEINFVFFLEIPRDIVHLTFKNTGTKPKSFYGRICKLAIGTKSHMACQCIRNILSDSTKINFHYWSFQCWNTFHAFVYVVLTSWSSFLHSRMLEGFSCQAVHLYVALWNGLLLFKYPVFSSVKLFHTTLSTVVYWSHVTTYAIAQITC